MTFTPNGTCKASAFMFCKVVCTDCKFNGIFNIYLEMYNSRKIDLDQLNPDVWKTSKKPDLCRETTSQMKILSVFAALHSGDYETAREEI